MHVYVYVCLCGHVAHWVAMANCLQLMVEFRAYTQQHFSPEDMLQKFGHIMQELGAFGPLTLGFVCVTVMDHRALADRLASSECILDFGP